MPTEQPADRSDLSFPAPRGSSALPNPLTPLIDREQSVLAVLGLLRDPGVRLLTLTGPGGVGKTRLALAVADRAAADFRDGVVFINLAAIANPDLVLPTIAAALGLRDLSQESLQDRLYAVLADKRFLLLLDNFEQVVVAGPRLRDLLAACPELTLLVTSRIRLRLSGEREFPLAPLALPPVDVTSVAEAEQAGAIQLFLERARAIQPNFALTGESLRAVTGIVRRVDGLPLAIELAAARLNVLPPAALLARMEQRLPLLSGGARDLPLRQQTMRDTIGWSYDLLPPGEQDLFRRLAVFVGGFTLDAAAAVGVSSEDEPVAALEAVEGVAALIDHSLLQRAGADHEPRYHMLETVREFGLERLRERGEGDLALQRHAAWFRSLAERAASELEGPDQGAWQDRLATELPNLRLALAWASGHDPDLAQHLAGALHKFWLVRVPLDEARETIEVALAVGEGSASARARATTVLAFVRAAQGDFVEAATIAGAALELARTTGNDRITVSALRAVGFITAAIGRHANPPDQAMLGRARATTREELDLARRMQDPNAIGDALYDLGALALDQGDFAAAAAHLAEAVPLFQTTGNPRGLGWTFVELGRVAAGTGDDVRAASLFGQALTAFGMLGDRWSASQVMEDVAEFALRKQQPEIAGRLLGAAAALRALEGMLVDSVRRGERGALAREVRRSLGEARFTAALTAGGSLAFDHAVEEAQALLSGPSAGDAAPMPPAPPFGVLTAREREVLRLVVDGRSDREIGRALSISERTAGGHVLHILQKLGVESRTAAAVNALRHGLI